MRKIYFIYPEFGNITTGGTLYDFYLCKYLKKIFIYHQSITVNHDISNIKIFRKIKSIPKDSIIIIDGYLANRIKYLLKKYNNIHLLVHHPCSLEDPADTTSSLRLFFNEKIAFTHAQSITTVSKYMKSRISRYLNRSSKISVVYPGIRECFFNCKTDVESIDILSIGNLIPRKGFEWLVESLSRLNIDWHLNIIGSYSIDNNYYEKVTNLIRKHKLEDKITFLGTVEKNVMLDYMQNSKLFVLATHYEGFGMALLESSISGLKVITTDLPVLREVLRNRDVDFVEEDNIDSLAKCIEYNLSHTHSLPITSCTEKYGWKRAARNFKMVLYGKR
ncbi:MAG: glycosyltransferase family 4 protein [Gammaproteobacteria bacterium]|jgi:glycosyltransferase involved in cell wall biosynthesis|nr:glycosyltransferase family 4 protein [Gammaproteobacteria bacterium]MBT4462625.1 glycosyltransferase family 4 protein [Gammaproteobacteria bacterium]MBT4654872.1 glycosyltransferase family 4 protein [Gammaproteobacteria bacterium]MBT5116628.1 glycosyltransferase family 4 protein [Gammaproteobacteria bacterium]MBT5761745.1 glycosyltransferase family 4 protein [Gammaproteobacteria bacterium]